MKRNIYLILAGILNMFTAFLHTVGGHMDHLSPVLQSAFRTVDKTVLLGVWHMVSIVMFVSCYPVLKKGVNASIQTYDSAIRYFGIIYVLWGLLFIGCSLYMDFHAMQWVLLLPIGILMLLGVKKKASS